MLFGMVSGVGQGMGVLDGAVLGVNMGCPIVTNGDFAKWLFPTYFGQYLFWYAELRNALTSDDQTLLTYKQLHEQ